MSRVENLLGAPVCCGGLCNQKKCRCDEDENFKTKIRPVVGDVNGPDAGVFFARNGMKRASPRTMRSRFDSLSRRFDRGRQEKCGISGHGQHIIRHPKSRHSTIFRPNVE
jgi:hypothetical protein